MKHQIEIDAVCDRDLVQILDDFELANSILKGDLNCPYCGRIITNENIGAIQPLDDTLVIICDDVSCIEEAVKENG